MEVKIKKVLELMRSHYEKDNNKFRNICLDIEKDCALNDCSDLGNYILALTGDTNTFCPGGGEVEDKATEIIEFFLDNKQGFKNQVMENIDSLNVVDREMTMIYDDIKGENIDISLEDILEESFNVVLKAIGTFEKNNEKLEG